MKDRLPSCGGPPPAADVRTIVVRHHAEIYRYARWLTRSDQDAEDLAQSALMKTLERNPDLPDEASVKWYLLRVVRNLATDQARARARVQVHPYASVPERATADVHADEIATRSEERLLSHAALARLPECHREVLRLRFLEGLGYPAVAGHLEITEQAARQRVYRAVRAMRVVLSSRAFRPT